MTTKTYTTRPIQALGATVALWLVINAACDAANVIFAAIDLSVISQLSPGMPIGFFDEIPDPSGVTIFTGLGRIPAVLVYLVTAFLVLKWIYRSSRNAHALAPGLRNSPPWAVGWFFVPFANFWKPHQSLSEVWRVSKDPQNWRRFGPPGAMSGWWTFWLISSISGNISFQVSRRMASTEGLLASTSLELLSALTAIPAALLLRQLVKQISAMQTDQMHTSVF